jgi:hypothetical protein
MIQRTAMFIDIQGFGKLYRSEADSLWGLADLMEGVYRLGQESTRLGISRLFAHHIGDGFVLIDDGGVANASRLAAAAVALHQFTLVRSLHFCASAVAEGEMADVLHCYPKMVLDARADDGVVRLGEGLMTLFPVMGTAIINTNRMLKEAHGSVILVSPEQKPKLEAGLHCIEEDHKLFVNWITSASPTISLARQILGIDAISIDELRSRFQAAIERNACPSEWVTRTSHFLA